MQVAGWGSHSDARENIFSFRCGQEKSWKIITQKVEPRAMRTMVRRRIPREQEWSLIKGLYLQFESLLQRTVYFCYLGLLGYDEWGFYLTNTLSSLPHLHEEFLTLCIVVGSGHMSCFDQRMWAKALNVLAPFDLTSQVFAFPPSTLRIVWPRNYCSFNLGHRMKNSWNMPEPDPQLRAGLLQLPSQPHGQDVNVLLLQTTESFWYTAKAD